MWKSNFPPSIFPMFPHHSESSFIIKTDWMLFLWRSTYQCSHCCFGPLCFHYEFLSAQSFITQELTDQGKIFYSLITLFVMLLTFSTFHSFICMCSICSIFNIQHEAKILRTDGIRVEKVNLH